MLALHCWDGDGWIVRAYPFHLVVHLRRRSYKGKTTSNYATRTTPASFCECIPDLRRRTQLIGTYLPIAMTEMPTAGGDREKGPNGHDADLARQTVWRKSGLSHVLGKTFCSINFMFQTRPDDCNDVHRALCGCSLRLPTRQANTAWN